MIEHGRDFSQFRRLGRFPAAGERVRVLVPGNISVSKGARILQQLQAMNAQGRFEFHLMGEYVRELEGTPNLVLHGPYDREKFGELARRIAPHFGVVLSIWPETFCHTLTEMWAAGLPVAAIDLGAVGDRIRRHGGGWLIDARRRRKRPSRRLPPSRRTRRGSRRGSPRWPRGRRGRARARRAPGWRTPMTGSIASLMSGRAGSEPAEEPRQHALL